MIFRSFASFLFLASGAFVLIVFLVLGMSVGAFGPGARDTLSRFLQPIQFFYGQHNSSIETAIRWLGGFLSVVTGTFAIYKSWYYAEFSLPRRLTDLIRRRNSLLSKARQGLLGWINDFLGDRHRMTPVVYFHAIDRLLKSLGIGRPRYRVGDLIDSIEANARELAVVRARMTEIENEIVTGHLLKGCLLAAEAAVAPQTSSERRTKNEEALLEFKAALCVISDDIDALMFAAKQSELMGDEGSALHYLACMEAAAASKEQPLRHAQAFRMKAKLLANSKWDDARRNATAGIEILDGMIETSLQKALELIKTLIVLGGIQIKRERFTAARRALDRACALLLQLDLRAQMEIKKTLESNYKDLDAAEVDKGQPGD